MSFFNNSRYMRSAVILALLLFISCSENNKTSSVKETPTQSTALLIDTSITMISPDFAPTRIKAVVERLKKIINNKDKNESFSVIVFSGNSYIHCPLTANKEKLLSAVSEIEKYCMSLNPGTNIPEGLLNAAYSLNNVDSGKSILIFSDGPTNVNTYSPKLATAVLLTENIKLNAVIISPKKYELLPDRADINGNLIFKKIKVKPIDKQLIEISSQTKGVYKIVNTPGDINNFNIPVYTDSSNPPNSDVATFYTDAVTIEKIYSELEQNNLQVKIKMKSSSSL